MGKYYVYVHIDPTTNLVRYVGKGHGKRAYDFHQRGAHHKNWLNILKSQNLKPIIEILASDLEETRALELEVLWIAAYRSEGIKLCNLTNGGDGVSGWVPSVETRKKWSNKLKGRVAPNKGIKHSQSTIQKMKVRQLKKVICLSNHTEYPSVKAAANLLGCNPSAISMVCNGKRKSTQGLIFTFVQESA